MAHEKIMNILDRVLMRTSKQHLDSAIPATSQPTIITISNPNNVTQIMTYTYEKYIRPHALKYDGQNLVKINKIAHIAPIMDMEWQNKSSSVSLDWGDLGMYKWHVSNGHTVLIINLHHIKYSRFAYMLQVLHLLTVGKTQSKVSQRYFSSNIHHIIIQHLECLPKDNASTLLNIIESTMNVPTNVSTDVCNSDPHNSNLLESSSDSNKNSGTSDASGASGASGAKATNGNMFRYYLFSTTRLPWKSSICQKLYGLCRRVSIGFNVESQPSEWQTLYKYLSNDIVKTDVICDQMPRMPRMPKILGTNTTTSSTNDIEKHVYAYLILISPLFKCLDKFFSRTVFIRRAMLLNTRSASKLPVKKQELLDLFQVPMILSNNLIGSGYSVSSVINTCNIVVNYLSKHSESIILSSDKISSEQVIRVVQYGNEMIVDGLDIDKPVVALVSYFQKIINLFSPLDELN